MSDKDEIKRGDRARQILEDDIFKDAVLAIREALLQGIRTSAFKDEKLREKLCHRFCLLEDLIGEIRAVMETGHMAAIEEERKSVAAKIKEMVYG